MKKFFIILIVVVIFTSCNSTQYLHDPGTYTTKERDGDLTQFPEVKDTYYIFWDTLKKNDKIVINIVKARSSRKGHQRMI